MSLEGQRDFRDSLSKDAPVILKEVMLTVKLSNREERVDLLNNTFNFQQ